MHRVLTEKNPLTDARKGCPLLLLHHILFSASSSASHLMLEILASFVSRAYIWNAVWIFPLGSDFCLPVYNINVTYVVSHI